MSKGKKQTISMRGVIIDMDAMRAANETVPAMGNTRMNARGDILGTGGRIVTSREDLTREYYKSNPQGVKHVSLKGAMADVFESPSEAVARLTQGVEEVEMPEGVLDRKTARKLVNKED
jgi:hypothetical protein